VQGVWERASWSDDGDGRHRAMVARPRRGVLLTSIKQ
jgi:hypothetical protein